MFLALQSKYPQFAQPHNGIYMQQDAEECRTQLLFTLSYLNSALFLISINKFSLTLFNQSIHHLYDFFSSEGDDTVKRLSGIDLVSRGLEGVKESTETDSVYPFRCHISQEVNHLHEGLKEHRSSPSLGRSAIYPKDSRINDLFWSHSLLPDT
ncbi:deubiquitinating enzyme [Castilleja foliolosa]|uniref:ubiquitinyl hydrolase 1 n=1 Tax=Castilleja foliolosa TaxID=1961234 RepID=A0ABD3BR02_9LAMI